MTDILLESKTIEFNEVNYIALSTPFVDSEKSYKIKLIEEIGGIVRGSQFQRTQQLFCADEYAWNIDFLIPVDKIKEYQNIIRMPSKTIEQQKEEKIISMFFLLLFVLIFLGGLLFIFLTDTHRI